MNIIWLGQAGFLLECNGKKLLLDPYLSNACGEVNPASYRRTPLDARYLAIKPDVILLTHDHADHTDMETLKHYLPGTGDVLVLAGANAWEKVRSLGGNNNYVCFRPGSQWRWENVVFTAVPAVHSDPEAIGFIVEEGGKKYYFTGDTLYSEKIFPSLPQDLHAVFVPINGKGNNMNATDAAAFAARTGAKYSIPIHFGMFDQLDPTIFKTDNGVIPTAYQPVFPEDAQ